MCPEQRDMPRAQEKARQESARYGPHGTINHALAGSHWPREVCLPKCRQRRANRFAQEFAQDFVSTPAAAEKRYWFTIDPEQLEINSDRCARLDPIMNENRLEAPI